MNKLIIIGNGFDLAHGLKTKYSDFIIWYFQEIQKSLENCLNYEDELINITTKISIDKYVLNSPKDVLNYVQILKQNKYIQFSYKSRFLYSIMNEISVLNWIDIEMIFYQELIKLYRLFKSSNDNNFNASINKLNQELDYVHSMLTTYIKTIQITENEHFNEYILEKLKSEYQKSTNLNNDILFLVFNYTDTINMYLNDLRCNTGNVIWIHGELYSETNKTIFGYGDQLDDNFKGMEKTNLNAFMENMKSFYYNQTSNYKRLQGFLNKGSFNVLLMGHSCGVSDRTILNSILEHEKCFQIKLAYHQISKDKNDFKDKMIEIYRHFSDDKKKLMLDRMVSFENSYPLNNEF